MANSQPIVIASNQSTVPVTANAGTNLNTSALVLDVTLTGGTAKSIARGGAKGSTTAADVTSTNIDANTQALDVSIKGVTAAVQVTSPTGTELGSVVRTLPAADLFITGLTGQINAGQNIINAAGGIGATDTVNGVSTTSYNSVYIQITPTGTVTSGTVLFEASNNNINFVALNLYDTPSYTFSPNSAVSFTTGVSRFFEGKTRYRYIRARLLIPVAGGGSIQCFTRLSSQDYQASIQTVNQPLASDLQVNATVNAVGTLQNGQTAHSLPSTGSPVRVSGRVVATTAGTQDQTLITNDVSDIGITTGQQLITKDFGDSNTDWQFAVIAPIASTTDVVIKAASGVVGIRNYLTAISITNSSTTVSTEVVVKDGLNVIWRGFVGANTLANSVQGVTFPTPLRGTTNTALNVACITTLASVYVNAQGYTGV